MNDNIPYEIIGKVLNNRASENELQEFELWKSSEPESKSIIEELEFINMPVSEEMPDFNSEIALENVSRKLKKTKKKYSMTVMKVAASVIIAFSLAFFILTKSVFVKEVVIVAESDIRKVTLPDNSVIELNKGSKLLYNKGLKGKNRIVELEGEAYFIVSSDSSRPFMVITGGLITEVLGTKFNINAELTKDVKVSLDEGSVKLYAKKKQKEVLLKPGEAAVFIAEKDSIANTEYSSNSNAWKSGMLVFEDVSLEKALRDIENLYKIEFILKKNIPDSIKINAKFNKMELDEIIKSLEFGFNLNIDKQNSKYLVRY
jgi:ferric-dicitrate binding protein FerR (iron transport regulator)